MFERMGENKNKKISPILNNQRVLCYSINIYYWPSQSTVCVTARFCWLTPISCRAQALLKWSTLPKFWGSQAVSHRCLYADLSCQTHRGGALGHCGLLLGCRCCPEPSPCQVHLQNSTELSPLAAKCPGRQSLLTFYYTLHAYRRVFN